MLASAVVVALALAGCSAGVTPTPSPTSTASLSNALDSLRPVIPKRMTDATAKTATDNLAKQIDSLVASSDIVYIDNHEKVIKATKTTGATYAVIRTINVSPSLNPLQIGRAHV